MNLCFQQKEKESFERMHNDSLKVVEAMTTEVYKEKEELTKKHEESLKAIETLTAENVSIHQRAFNSHCVLFVF